ncbi:MAG: hypothetical protein DRP81_05950, partial [Candidatus Omnitrophota bacterium]
SNWLISQKCFKGKGLAVDGKVLRGGGLKLLSAIVHKEGINKEMSKRKNIFKNIKGEDFGMNFQHILDSKVQKNSFFRTG